MPGARRRSQGSAFQSQGDRKSSTQQIATPSEIADALRPVAHVAAAMFAQKNFTQFMAWLGENGDTYSPVESAALYMSLTQDNSDLGKALVESRGACRKAQEKPTTS